MARIPGDTTIEELAAHFSKFGEVKDIKLDTRTNGKCSGSASLNAATKEGFDAICKGKHIFKERTIVATPFLAKEKMSTINNAYHKRKVVLTKIPPHITE